MNAHVARFQKIEKYKPGVISTGFFIVKTYRIVTVKYSINSAMSHRSKLPPGLLMNAQVARFQKIEKYKPGVISTGFFIVKSYRIVTVKYSINSAMSHQSKFPL
jgi:ribose 5-phosphate isomerase